MNKIVIAIFFALLLNVVDAQTDCNLQRYNELIVEGDNYFKSENYESAVKSYSAAMTACKDKILEVQKKTQVVFSRINQLKLSAELAKKNALRQKQIADTLLLISSDK